MHSRQFWCSKVTRLAQRRLNIPLLYGYLAEATSHPTTHHSFIGEKYESRDPHAGSNQASGPQNGLRLLGLALYRAFLSHLPHLPLNPAQTRFAEWYIRSEFKRNQDAQGIKPVRKALSYARQSEPLMRAAAIGDPESITKLSEEITKLQRKREEDLFVATLSPPPPKPPPPPTTMPTRKKKLRRLDPNYKPPPRSPIPRLPKLIESNMFPILRWPGQKTALHIAIIIKKKTVQKQRRLNLVELLEDWIVLAQEEDTFDKIITMETGVREEGGSWEEGVRSTWRDVKDLMRKEELRGAEMTKRFIEIIEQKRIIRDDMILERDRKRRRKKREKYRLRRFEREKREREEAKLLERETDLEGQEKTTAGEWDEGCDAPSADHCLHERPGMYEQGEEHERGYKELENGDPEHGYDGLEQENKECEHDDPGQGYKEPDSSNSDFGNTNPTPDPSTPPASEPTSTPEDKP